MRLYFANKNDPNDIKIFENPNNAPIPRVGESIVAGYLPSPVVTGVIYDYKNNTVGITIDGWVKFMEFPVTVL